MDRETIEQVYREDYGRILATLIKVLGDFELAEEAAQDAFAVALERWPREGLPRNPAAWLISVARNKAIDRLRRREWFHARQDQISAELEEQQMPGFSDSDADSDIPDERLRLIFTCCHPALNREAQVALSLRTLCGLSTDEIARAFLVPAPTVAQRLVRAQRKISAARIPYAIPAGEQIQERLQAVMAVIYLVFNEGYAASRGDSLVRADLSAEAIRLARMLFALMPAESEPRGLLALMLLHDARRETRIDPAGDLVLLEDQDRSRWNHRQIAEGMAHAAAALEVHRGLYALQAAIAAEHDRAARSSDTDWHRIASLYDELLAANPSPVIELNRAAAVSMAQGPKAGLRLIEEIEKRGELAQYYLLWSVRADLLRRLYRHREAAAAYKSALTLVTTAPERRFLKKRLNEVEAL